MTTTTKDQPAVETPEIDTRKYHEMRPILRGHVGQIDTIMAHYPDSVRDDAIWLRHYCAKNCNNEHALIAKIAASIGIEQSDNYWYQILTGRYFRPGGSASKLKECITQIRNWAIARTKEGRVPFVETRNWRLVRDYIDTRRAPGFPWKFGAIEGVTSTQKTACGKHYRDLRNHLATVHLESPAKVTRPRFVSKLASAYLLNAGWSAGRKEIELETIINPDRAIILDNVQRLLKPGIKADQQPIFNYIHELQDDTDSTWIFTFVPTFRSTITSADPFWRQFLARIGGEDQILKLEQRLPKADIIAFAKAYNVVNDAAAYPILKRWSETPLGIRTITGRLHLARLMANLQGSDVIQVGHLESIETEPLNIHPDDQEESA